MTIPLVVRVQKQYPNAIITVLLVKRNAVLCNMLKNMGIETYVMPDFDGKKKYLTLFSVWMKWWKSFDLCINGLEPRKIDHLLMWGIAKKTMAYTEENWHGNLITHSKPFKKAEMQQIHQSQFISNIFDRTPITYDEWPKINPENYPLNEALPRIDKNYRYIFISASNNRPSSTLLPEDYAHILIPFCQKYPFRIIISYLEKDKLLAEKIRGKLQPHAEIIITPDFSTLLHLMNKCDLFFLGDGGLSHLAASLGKFCLTLFGETSPIEWKPLNNQGMILYDKNDVKLIDRSLIIKYLDELIQKVIHQ